MTIKTTLQRFGLLAGLAFFSATPLTAYAKTSLNALCYLNPKSKAVVGNNLNTEFELASTSKVVTTYWALARLGPQFRFQTKINLMQRSQDGTFDIHIEGNQNPYFNQEMVYFLGSELSKLGVKKIGTLSFDEHLKIFWQVRNKKMAAARSFDPDPRAVETVLHNAFVKNGFDPVAYNQVAKAAKNIRVDMVSKVSLRAERIEYVTQERFQQIRTDNMITFNLQSSPLYMILKEMNIYSNNYVADMLYGKLGGNAAFEKFAKENLDADQHDISFVNGSGDSEYSDMETDHSKSQNGKWYNKANCSTMIHVLINAQTILKKSGLDLDDVMAVSAADSRSTLGARYASLPKSVIAKTGSVNPAIGLTGMLSTKSGDLLFVVLMKTDGKADWGTARNNIRKEIGKLMAKFGGPIQVEYTPRLFMPFDAESGLKTSLKLDSLN